jgi:hypothetical protein
MFSQKYSQAILLVLFFSFFMLQSNLQSQEKKNEMSSKINVTMIASEGGFSDLEMSVINTFKKVLEENGLFSENDNDIDIELLLKVKKTEDDNKIILYVLEMQVLPKKTVEVGKKAEIFYSMLDDNKKANLPEEGKFIREYMSAEFMKQFRMIWDDILEIIDINEIESFSQKIVAKYL